MKTKKSEALTKNDKLYDGRPDAGSSSRKHGAVADAAGNQPLCNTEQIKTLNQIAIFF